MNEVDDRHPETSLAVIRTVDAEHWTASAARIARRAGRLSYRFARHVVEHVDIDARRHLSQLPSMALTSLGPRRRKVQPLPDDGFNPLIFVHGLGGHPGNHLALRSYLGLQGRRRIYTVDLGKGTPLTEAAGLVSKTVERVVAANGLPAHAQVDLIAHSMGGLITRLALEDELTRRRVARIVTMGSPHRGTIMARLVGPSVARAQELRIDSQTIATLNAQLPWPTSWPKFVSLWSPNDVLVMPNARAAVAGADNRKCDGYTHFTWLLERRGWQTVERALAS